MLAFAGLPLGIFNVITYAMVADSVDYLEWKTGERNEGMGFSILTFISKLTGSLSSAIATAIIPIIGPQEVGQDMVLNEASGINTRFWLWGLITAIPAVLGLIQLIPYHFYDLEGEKLTMIQTEVQRRREEASAKMVKEEV